VLDLLYRHGAASAALDCNVLNCGHTAGTFFFASFLPAAEANTGRVATQSGMEVVTSQSTTIRGIQIQSLSGS
jgi:hypothetical protein